MSIIGSLGTFLSNRYKEQLARQKLQQEQDIKVREQDRKDKEEARKEQEAIQRGTLQSAEQQRKNVETASSVSNQGVDSQVKLHGTVTDQEKLLVEQDKMLTGHSMMGVDDYAKSIKGEPKPIRGVNPTELKLRERAMLSPDRPGGKPVYPPGHPASPQPQPIQQAPVPQTPPVEPPAPVPQPQAIPPQVQPPAQAIPPQVQPQQTNQMQPLQERLLKGMADLEYPAPPTLEQPNIDTSYLEKTAKDTDQAFSEAFNHINNTNEKIKEIDNQRRQVYQNTLAFKQNLMSKYENWSKNPPSFNRAIGELNWGQKIGALAFMFYFGSKRYGKPTLLLDDMVNKKVGELKAKHDARKTYLDQADNMYTEIFNLTNDSLSAELGTKIALQKNTLEKLKLFQGRSNEARKNVELQKEIAEMEQKIQIEEHEMQTDFVDKQMNQVAKILGEVGEMQGRRTAMINAETALRNAETSRARFEREPYMDAIKHQYDIDKIDRKQEHKLRLEAVKKGLEGGGQLSNQKHLFGNTFISGVDKESNIIPVQQNVSDLISNRRVADHISKEISFFEKENYAGLVGRVVTPIKDWGDKFGIKSEQINRMRSFHQQMSFFFAQAKEVLGLGRLSDWDAQFIMEFLGMKTPEDPASSDPSDPSYFTPSKLSRMRDAVNSLQSKMRKRVQAVAKPVDSKTGKLLSQEEFYKRVGRESLRR